MDLIIDNKIIEEDIDVILDKLNHDIKGHYFRERIPRGNNLNITCPFHKNGKENHPSCNIYIDKKSKEIPYGFYRCFTCGESGTLYNFVGKMFGADDEFGKHWLIDNFGELLDSKNIELDDEIVLKPESKKYLNDSIIDSFESRHPYMYQRGLTDDVIDRFQIKYDKETDEIIFPVWDEHGRLIMLSRRSVSGKTFKLEKAVEKPVYLLYDAVSEGRTTVCVVESQIDALKLWSWGYPAVALFGTGADRQYEILKRSGIRHYILCFDGDNAGDTGAKKFIKNMKGQVFITQVVMPRGKDIGDLSKEEFEKLLTIEC